MKIKYEYEITRINNDDYAVCEYRWMDHSVNVKHIFKSDSRKDCIEWLKEYKKNGNK